MQMNYQAQLINTINYLSFAMDDARLFLDTHPECQEALEYFNDTMTIRNKAVEEYTAKFGPISSYFVNVSDGWSWDDCPLPWNGGM